MKAINISVLVFSFLYVPVKASCQEAEEEAEVETALPKQESHPDRAIVFEGDHRYPDLRSELGKSKIDLQERWGNILLASGFVVALAGAFLVEADGWGGAGKAGFTGVGAGIGISITGMLLLSLPFSKHRYKLRRL